MSINRFLFSACLPVMIFSLTANITPVHAGFDWTPPEDTKEVVMPDVPVTPVDEQSLPPVEDRSGQDGMMPVFEQPIIKNQKAGEVKMKTKVLVPKQPEEVISTDSSVIPLPTVKQAVQPVEGNQKTITGSKEELAPAVKKINPIKAIQKAQKPQQEIIQPQPQEIYKGGADVDSYAGAKKEKNNQKSLPRVQDEVEIQVPEQDINKPKNNELLINPFPLEENKSLPARKDDEIVPAHSAVKAVENVPPVADNNSAPSTSSYPIVEGFGADMPLVMALGQIVPAQYAYSFGKGVNPGVIISWEGGMPWNEVLKGILQPLGLDMKIEGNKLSLFAIGAEETVVIQRPKENASIPSTESYPDPDNTGRKLQGKKEKDQPLKNPAKKHDAESVPLSVEKSNSEQAEKTLEIKEEKQIEQKSSLKENKKKEEKSVELKDEATDLTKPSMDEKKNSKQHSQLEAVLETAPPSDSTKPQKEEVTAFPEFEMKDGKLLSPSAPKNAKKTEEKAEEKKISKPGDDAKSDKSTKEEKETPKEVLIPNLPKGSEPEIMAPMADVEKKAPADLKQIKVWEAKKGKDLQTLLKEWCNQIGVELVWSSKDQYRLAHNVVVSGTLESALKVTFAQAIKNAPQYEVVKGDAPQVIVK